MSLPEICAKCGRYRYGRAKAAHQEKGVESLNSRKHKSKSKLTPAYAKTRSASEFSLVEASLQMYNEVNKAAARHIVHLHSTNGPNLSQGSYPAEQLNEKHPWCLNQSASNYGPHVIPSSPNPLEANAQLPTFNNYLKSVPGSNLDDSQKSMKRKPSVIIVTPTHNEETETEDVGRWYEKAKSIVRNFAFEIGLLGFASAVTIQTVEYCMRTLDSIST